MRVQAVNVARLLLSMGKLNERQFSEIVQSIFTTSTKEAFRRIAHNKSTGAPMKTRTSVQSQSEREEERALSITMAMRREPTMSL